MSDNEILVLSDAQAKKITEVENRCHMCGVKVMKHRLLTKARCFDCRKKKLIEYAKKSQHRKYATLEEHNREGGKDDCVPKVS